MPGVYVIIRCGVTLDPAGWRDQMAAENLFRSVFFSDRTPGLVFSGDRVLVANPAAADRWRRPLDTLAGMELSAMMPAQQADESPSLPLWKDHRTAARDGGPRTFAWLFLDGQGDTFEALVSLTLLEIEAETHLLVRLIEQEQAPAAATAAPGGPAHCAHREKLDSLGLMAGGVAHDFNNYLLAILGNADLLDRDLAAGKAGDDLLMEIRKAAGRAADLCNQLLAYAGRGQAQFQNLDLSAIVQEMVPMLKVAISRKIVLRLDLEHGLPLVEGDLAQLHQLVMNLVVNASEAIGNRQGGITLSSGRGVLPAGEGALCSLGGGSSDENMVFLEIKDDGSGISPELQSRIFDPYFSTKIPGRGMGLATVLGTVRSHQGALCIMSSNQEGTALRVYFPQSRTDQSRVPKAASTGVALPGRGTILVVDDEEYLRVLCSRMLQRLGYQVLLAAGGVEALDLYQSHSGRIDGVILDLVMPVMDGLEVLERLLSLDPEVRVVMTSGYHEQEIAARFSGKGIAGFLQKPYVLSDLGEALQAIFKNGE
jgi:two-component system cell cycle sensor histidine kinase/response regulator CckA